MKAYIKVLSFFIIAGMLGMFSTAAYASTDSGLAFGADSTVVDVDGLKSSFLNNSAYADKYTDTSAFTFEGLWDVQGIGYDTLEWGFFEGWATFSADYGDPAVATKMYSSNSLLYPVDNALGPVYESVDLNTAYFTGWEWGASSPVDYYLTASNVNIYVITQDFEYDGVTFNAGDMVLIFEIHANCDWNDLAVLARPTPIPGAIWLMGSGLLGLIGWRRKTMKTKA